MPRVQRVAPLLVVLLALSGACSLRADATFEPGVEHLPGPGYIHLVTAPASAEIELTFRLIVPDGTDSSVSTTVPAGEPVVIDLTTLPGVHAIRMNETACLGRFPVEGDRVTDLVVRITTNGCATAVSGIHDVEEMRHP